MSQTPTTQTIQMPDGNDIILETGKLAKQADGSCVLRCGDTLLLATVVSARELKPGMSFFPLSVDYQEKFASNGRIPGGFLKREGRLSNYEILNCRLIDRTLRPLFPDGYKYETQVMVSLQSADSETLPDSLAALAASTALAVSDIPFAGPISECRVGRIDGKFIINPTRSQLAESDIDMIIGATIDNVMMVEGEMAEISEDEMIQAIAAGHAAIKTQCQAQIDLAKAVGKHDVVREYTVPVLDEEIYNTVKAAVESKILDVARGGLGKNERYEGFQAIKNDYIESLGEDVEDEHLTQVKNSIRKVHKATIRNMMIDEGKRLDGRAMDQVRELTLDVDYLPSAHGSSVFTRGETQALATATLGNKLDEQMIDGALDQRSDRFYLHYNFPGFSTGEARPNRGPGRREIGHGHLAMRSIKQVLPSHEECPYTIRIVSDILESNGSSSMATVCAGSMALRDAGVNITSNVSGVAMGMVSREDGKYAILTDILGDEDHLGDMDFKVTGTDKGICACQMDIKIDGLSDDILREALMQAKQGREHILNQMNEACPAARPNYKDNVPKMVTITIHKDFIGAVIGPGGKIIQEMQKETGTTIMIEEVDEQGVVTISGIAQDGIDSALAKIRGITATPEVNEVYEAKVMSIMPYGAFVEFMPGKQGLLHISEISWSRLENMDNVFEVGELVKVKLLEIDQRSGKFRLSRKVLMDKPDQSS